MNPLKYQVIVTDIFGRRWRLEPPLFINIFSWGTWFPWYPYEEHNDRAR